MMVTLGNTKFTVRIEAGELVGLLFDAHEFIHQKGSPGWRSADTEMFPIIGPLDKAGFHVQVPKGSGAIQDQHGLLRELEYTLVSQTETDAVFRKEYKAGTPVKNSKFPDKSTKPWLMWPYSFVFEKYFTVTEDGVEVAFKVSGDRDMPFMLGYHPAFKLYSDSPIIKTDDLEITLEEVLAVGSRALEVPNCDEIILKDERQITIKTEGFGHFMCWTEVPNMVCIEPITFYPYQLEQRQLHEGFDYLMEDLLFKVHLIPK